MTTAIWWIRRDLRLTNNQALAQASAQAAQVIPLFIFDRACWVRPTPALNAWPFWWAGGCANWRLICRPGAAT
jgi:deoxyribodipyrimidine photo-lyase